MYVSMYVNDDDHVGFPLFFVQLCCFAFF